MADIRDRIDGGPAQNNYGGSIFGLMEQRSNFVGPGTERPNIDIKPSTNTTSADEGATNDPAVEQFLSWLFEYMLNQVQSGRMYLVEVMQKFPVQLLPSKYNSLQDVFNEDVKKRFLVTVSTSKDAGRTREVVVLNDEVIFAMPCYDGLTEMWRRSIEGTLRENARLNKIKEMESSKLGSLCHRPKELPVAFKLLSVIERDPAGRFQVRRADNLIWVRNTGTELSARNMHGGSRGGGAYHRSGGVGGGGAMSRGMYPHMSVEQTLTPYAVQHRERPSPVPSYLQYLQNRPGINSMSKFSDPTSGGEDGTSTVFDGLNPHSAEYLPPGQGHFLERQHHQQMEYNPYNMQSQSRISSFPGFDSFPQSYTVPPGAAAGAAGAGAGTGTMRTYIGSAPPQPATSWNNSSVASESSRFTAQILDLYSLVKKGLLTEQEFVEAKAKILAQLGN